MSLRVTVSAPSNIAFVKYWGATDPHRVLPYHPSISLTLETCRSTSTVEASTAWGHDEVWLAEPVPRSENGPERWRRVAPSAAFAGKVLRHLETIRQVTGRAEHFRVATHNSFPSAAGLASSASGFAALAVAATRALGLDLPPEQLSVLARLSGSGSAARSVFGGFVQWPEGDGDAAGHAVQLAPASAWPLANVIVILETGAKEVSSLEGHRRAPTSPHFARRLELIDGRLDAVREAIRRRDLAALGPVLETDAIELHVIAMTSVPAIFYWNPATLAVLAAVRGLRDEGVSAWATMDAGANVHVITDPADEAAVAEHLARVPGVVGLIRDRGGDGPRLEDDDLLGAG